MQDVESVSLNLPDYLSLEGPEYLLNRIPINFNMHGGGDLTTSLSEDPFAQLKNAVDDVCSRFNLDNSRSMNSMTSDIMMKGGGINTCDLSATSISDNQFGGALYSETSDVSQHGGGYNENNFSETSLTPMEGGGTRRNANSVDLCSHLLTDMSMSEQTSSFLNYDTSASSFNMAGGNPQYFDSNQTSDLSNIERDITNLFNGQPEREQFGGAPRGNPVALENCRNF